MEFKGTKGKWEINDKSSGNYISVIDDFAIAKAFENAFITPEESEANAKLIAAAPLMLKALQSFVDDFETDYVIDGEIVDDPCVLLHANYDAIKEVIKQATE